MFLFPFSPPGVVNWTDSMVKWVGIVGLSLDLVLIVAYMVLNISLVGKIFFGIVAKNK